MSETFSNSNNVLDFVNDHFEKFGFKAYSVDKLGTGCWEIHFSATTKEQLQKAIPLFNPLRLIRIDGTLIPRFLIDDRAMALLPDVASSTSTDHQKFFKVDAAHIGFYCRCEEVIFKCIVKLQENSLK